MLSERRKLNVERRATKILEHESKEHEAGIRVHGLNARRPLEGELDDRVLVLAPPFRALPQSRMRGQPGRMIEQMPHCDARAILASPTRHEIRHASIQAQPAVVDRPHRERSRGNYLRQGSQIEN